FRHGSSSLRLMKDWVGLDNPLTWLLVPARADVAGQTFGVAVGRLERTGVEAEWLHDVVGRLRQRYRIIHRERAEGRGPGQADADRGAYDVGVRDLRG